MISPDQIRDIWNAFFHAPESCAPQVLFRLLFGAILTLNAVLLLPLTADFFSANGIWPHAAWQNHQQRRRLSLLNWLPATTGSARLLLLVHLLACLGFLVGWQFRISAVIVFLTLVSIHHRNTFVLSSGDTLLRLFSFLAIFSAAGQAMAVDVAGSRTTFPDVDPWPLRLMQILVSIVYLRTVFWKLRGRLWWQGTAAWYPLWVETYLRHRPPKGMLTTPWIRIATWGTLVVELALGTLIWLRPLRLPVMLLGVVMHLVFEVVLNLQLFGWTMIAGLLLFLDPQMAEDVLQTLPF